MEEGARKGALKIVCFTNTLDSSPRLAGIPLRGHQTKKKTVKVLNIGTWNVRTLLDNRNQADRKDEPH